MKGNADREYTNQVHLNKLLRQLVLKKDDEMQRKHDVDFPQQTDVMLMLR